MPKLYPFSLRHVHDIEYACNHTYDLLRDADCGVTELDTEDYVALTDRHEALTELLDAMSTAQSDGRVVYLTGPQIGLAKDAVLWAAGERERNGYWAPRRCRA